MENFRIIVQTLSILLINSDFLVYYKIFKSNRAIISQSPVKFLCVPGLNCYSCPSAVMSCPIGSLQFWLNDVVLKFKLKESINLAGLYIIGLISLAGISMGRWWCGWVCPFGFIQDLIGKLSKFNIKIPKIFKYFKYLSLLIFVIILPIAIHDITMLSPWFCKLICPAGTLLAGIPLLVADSGLRSSVSYLTMFKFFVLTLFVSLFFVSKRAFCKILCPLGAYWGLFNRISFYKLSIDKNVCINCGQCLKACPMNIDVVNDPNSSECIRCLACKKVCPVNAIHFVHPLSYTKTTFKCKSLNK